ncbi:hypothetical protein BLNAU_5295 [Blattamonas nauphoetae]|uniref:Transposase n=1 Tax=Blattamonas nauphoetae TaxID=2049346 RepID=A0ABQ9Y7T9_9EUKA|nr:hypothetical protein BLNAU_5295 [Blattamonas nauphoetae]
MAMCCLPKLIERSFRFLNAIVDAAAVSEPPFLVFLPQPPSSDCPLCSSGLLLNHVQIQSPAKNTATPPVHTHHYHPHRRSLSARPSPQRTDSVAHEKNVRGSSFESRSKSSDSRNTSDPVAFELISMNGEPCVVDRTPHASM